MLQLRPFALMRTSGLWLIMALMQPQHYNVQAAHSRRRPTARVTSSREVYDREITTFDPNGRLLQVEYGAQAASRGHSVLCAVLEDQGDNGVLYLALSEEQQVHRLDNHIFFVGTGLVGDSLLLAYNLRTWCQSHRLENGEPPTVREVAEQAGLWQHQQTHFGGSRPFGCMVIVAGVDPVVVAEEEKNESSGGESSKKKNKNGQQLQLFRSGPGGVVEDCLYCAAGKNQNTLMNRMRQEVYPKLLNENDSLGVESTIQLLASLLQTASEKDNKEEHKSTVWTIRPVFGRRGNLQASVHCNISVDKTS